MKHAVVSQATAAFGGELWLPSQDWADLPQLGTLLEQHGGSYLTLPPDPTGPNDTRPTKAKFLAAELTLANMANVYQFSIHETPTPEKVIGLLKSNYSERKKIVLDLASRIDEMIKNGQPTDVLMEDLSRACNRPVAEVRA